MIAKKNNGISAASMNLTHWFFQVFCVKDLQLFIMYLQNPPCFCVTKESILENLLRLNLNDMVHGFTRRGPFAKVMRRAQKTRLVESFYHSSIIAVCTYDIAWIPGVRRAYHAKQRVRLFLTVNRPRRIELLMAAVL